MNRDLYQWLGNPVGVEALAELLKDPILQRAIQIAQREVERKLDLQDGNILERAALSHAAAQGARELVSQLELLANPTQEMLRQVTPPKPLRPPYTHLAATEEKHSVV